MGKEDIVTRLDELINAASVVEETKRRIAPRQSIFIVDQGKYEEWASSAMYTLAQLGGRNVYFENFKKLYDDFKGLYDTFNRCRGIIIAAKNDLDAGQIRLG